MEKRKLFEEKYGSLFDSLGKSAKMTLATSLCGEVSARTMSVIILNKAFLFQTDATMRKYRQLTGNNRVALCFANTQIEGICRETGAPSGSSEFLEAYKACFPSSFERYTHLNNERLFAVAPTFVQRWVYIDGVPFVERFFVDEERYEIEEYKDT